MLGWKYRAPMCSSTSGWRRATDKISAGVLRALPPPTKESVPDSHEWIRVKVAARAWQFLYPSSARTSDNERDRPQSRVEMADGATPRTTAHGTDRPERTMAASLCWPSTRAPLLENWIACPFNFHSPRRIAAAMLATRWSERCRLLSMLMARYASACAGVISSTMNSNFWLLPLT